MLFESCRSEIRPAPFEAGVGVMDETGKEYRQQPGIEQVMDDAVPERGREKSLV